MLQRITKEVYSFITAEERRARLILREKILIAVEKVTGKKIQLDAADQSKACSARRKLLLHKPTKIWFVAERHHRRAFFAGLQHFELDATSGRLAEDRS